MYIYSSSIVFSEIRVQKDQKFFASFYKLCFKMEAETSHNILL